MGGKTANFQQYVIAPLRQVKQEERQVRLLLYDSSVDLRDTSRASARWSEHQARPFFSAGARLGTGVVGRDLVDAFVTLPQVAHS